MSKSITDPPTLSVTSDETIVTRPSPAPARVRIRTPPPSTDPTPDAASDQAPTAPAAPADYKVGYGKPPTRHQFQPGRSGNPKGRPKGSRSLSTLIGEELDKTVTARWARGG
jgi:hypothetical protein